MDKVIADILASNDAIDMTQLKALKEALACSESLARLFPDDIEANNKEMIKIAAAFLNHAYATVDGMPAKDPIREELSVINSIIKACKCPNCAPTEPNDNPIEPDGTDPISNPGGNETIIDPTDFTQHDMVTDPSAVD